VGVFRRWWYGQSLDRAVVGLWGWESWSLRRLASAVVRGRWIWCGKSGRGRRIEPLSKLSLSPLLRDLTKLSPWPRLLHKRSDYQCHWSLSRCGSYDNNNTKVSVTPSTQMQMHIQATPPLAARKSTIATMQAGNMAATERRHILLSTQKTMHRFRRHRYM
jgi:hypothetical protein